MNATQTVQEAQATTVVDTNELIKNFKTCTSLADDTQEDEIKKILVLLKEKLKKRCCALDNTADEVISIGYMDLMDFAFECGSGEIRNAIMHAKAKGHLEIVTRLFNHGYEFKELDLQNAVFNNHCDVAEFLLKNGIRGNEELIEKAAGFEDTQMLKILLDHDLPFVSFEICKAAKAGNAKVVEAFMTHAHGGIFADPAMEIAAYEGHLDVIKIMIKHCLPCTYDAIFSAAHEGHIEILDLLIENTWHVSDEELTNIVRSCNIEAVKVLLKHGVIITEETVKKAKCNEDIEVEKMLRSHLALKQTK